MKSEYPDHPPSDKDGVIRTNSVSSLVKIGLDVEELVGEMMVAVNTPPTSGSAG